MTSKERTTTLAALKLIRDFPANGNSEPDVMAQALWDITVLAGMVVAMLEGADTQDHAACLVADAEVLDFIDALPKRAA